MSFIKKEKYAFVLIIAIKCKYRVLRCTSMPSKAQQQSTGIQHIQKMNNTNTFQHHRVIYRLCTTKCERNAVEKCIHTRLK